MMKLQDVILNAMAKRITWMAAAEIAGVSDRTMRRMRERYEEFEYDGLFRPAARERSIHRIPLETAERVGGEISSSRIFNKFRRAFSGLTEVRDGIVDFDVFEAPSRSK